jgi:hypothetical protein
MSTMPFIQHNALAFKHASFIESGLKHDLDYSENELLTSPLSSPAIKNWQGTGTSASILAKA